MKRCLRPACGFVLSVLVTAAPVRAVQWIGSSGDAFNATASWSGGVVPSGSNSTADFGGGIGTIIIQVNHSVGTFHFGPTYTSGGFSIRNGGTLALINGIVNDTSVSPEFTVRDGTLFFTGNAPQLGNASITVESAGLLKLFTANNPNGSAARVNLTGGRIGVNDTTDGGSVSLGELKGTGSTVGLGSAGLTVGALGTDATFAGEIATAASLTKVGAGTWTLASASTYTGPTLISGGTIRINNATGSAFGTGTVTVDAGATLGGSGAFTGALTVASGGTLAPGNSPGTLTAGDTTFDGGGTFQFQLNDATGSAGTNWDLLAVNGTLTLSATSGNPFNVDLTSLTLADAAGNAANFNSASDYSFTFLTTTGGVSGFSSDAFAIDTSHFSNPFSGTWSVLQTNSGHDLTLHYAGASAVPEPSTSAALAGLAALGLAFARRRRT